jgi:hypothetical protein
MNARKGHEEHAMKTIHCTVLSVLLSSAALPLAAQAGAERSQTEIWLELQRSGQQASEQVQTATPAERELAMQRWLDAQHPIPEYFQEGVEGKLDR